MSSSIDEFRQISHKTGMQMHGISVKQVLTKTRDVGLAPHCYISDDMEAVNVLLTLLYLNGVTAH